MDKVLLGALGTCAEVGGQLGGIHKEMEVLGNNFGMLAFKFGKAMDKSDQIQVDFWHAFLETVKGCSVECVSALGVPWVGLPQCGVCLGFRGSAEAKAEEARVDRLLKENTDYLKMINDSIGDLSQLAVDLGAQAASEKVTVD